MPLGKIYEVTGRLLRVGRQFVLQVDDGGVWRLEASPASRELQGLRVTVVGIR